MRIYLTTCGVADAETLVRSLLDARLIACANIMAPHRAIYRWQGEICEDDQEVQIWMECADSAAAQLRARLEQLHPYDTPKILELQASWTLPAFAAWCAEQTEPTRPDPNPDNVAR